MKNFPVHTTLTKIIAIVLVATGVLGLLQVGSAYIPIMDQMLSSGTAIAYFDMIFTTSLALLGLISGIAIWQKRGWALITAIVYFAIQVIMIELPNFFWAPQSGITLNYTFSAGYESAGNFGCGLNFFALGMLILTIFATRQLKRVDPEQLAYQ